MACIKIKNTEPARKIFTKKPLDRRLIIINVIKKNPYRLEESAFNEFTS